MEGENTVGDLSGVLGNILSDPAQMAKLTQLAGALASSGGLGALLGGNAPKADHAQATAEENTHAQAPEVIAPSTADAGTAGTLDRDAVTAALAKLGGGVGKVHITKHEALLRALRPYLSNERQTRIDGMLRLLTLVNVLGGVLQTTQEGTVEPHTPRAL